MSGYQSRVFTFISKRTNQLKDSCTRGLRHIKVAVVWSGQILLYPLQLLAQTIKIFPPQLPPPAQQLALPSPSPVPDINIEQALELVAGAGYAIVLADLAPLAVDNWAIIDENLWNLEHSHPDDNRVDDGIHQREIGGSSDRITSRKPIIRGLSSLLIDRQLVLVTTENEILDILTSSQQHEIRRRIGTDIARIWHQWHTDKLASHSRQSAGQLLLSDRDLLLDSSNTNQQLIGGDEQDSLQITQSDRDFPSPRLFDTVGEKLRQRWNDWLTNKTAKSPEKSDLVKPTLHERIESERQLPSNRYPFNIQPPKIERFLELPQLPPFNESNPSNVAAQPSPTQHPIQATLAKLQPDWLKQWLNYYRDYLYIPAKNDSQLVKQPAEFKLTPLGEPQIIKTGSTSRIIIQRVPRSIELKQTLDRQNLLDVDFNQLDRTIHPDLEYQPDWIEVDSELIGYNLSTIDKLLAWLDRLMLQIENWIVSIWDLITNNPARN